MKKALAVLTLILLGVAAAVVVAAPTRHRHGPAVKDFRFSPSTFSVPSSGGKGKAASRRATTVRLRLSAGASIRMAVSRRAAGRKVGRRCVKPTKRLRKQRACHRFVRVGTVRWSRHRAGKVALAFSGRVNGHRLKRGTYRATLVAVGRRGRRSDPRTARFAVASGAPAPASGAPPPAPPASGGAPPSPTSVGVPAGWTPAQTRSTNMTVTQAGAVVQDIRFTNGASLLIAAPNVTVRRIEMQGGQIDNEAGNGQCHSGLVVEDSTFGLRPGEAYDTTGTPAIQWGGYTARRVKVWYRSEGLFIGGKSAGCGPVDIEDTFIKLDDHNDCKLHADGMQGYDGNAVTVRNVISDSGLATCGTAPFFYPKDQGNTSATIDGLMVIGGGYSFRLGMPADVRNLRIVDNGAASSAYQSGHTWAYGPVDVNCSAIRTWQNVSIVRLDSPITYATTKLRDQGCSGVGN